MKLLQEGQIIRDTYEVERFLGEGAFGEVWRVKHRFLGRQAMKVFKLAGMTTEETEKHLGEALLLSRIGHPNIIRVFDANTVPTPIGQCGFFTMEYVAGGSLDDFWKSHGSAFVPVETTVNVVLQISRGLAVAHREKPPIVHRDIKPQNILVGYDAGGLRACLTDFGLAKRANPLNLRLSARGTPAFKAPEAFREVEGDSAAGDIWALGTTLYLLCTDRLPYPDPEILRDDDRTGAIVPEASPPSRINRKVDAELDGIISRCLTIARDARYQTATELMLALETWQSRRAETPAPGKPAAIPAQTVKTALGRPSMHESKGREMADRALQFAREISRLKEAADLMEEAFNHSPDLRAKYDYKVKLWRRGLVM